MGKAAHQVERPLHSAAADQPGSLSCLIRIVGAPEAPQAGFVKALNSDREPVQADVVDPRFEFPIVEGARVSLHRYFHALRQSEGVLEPLDDATQISRGQERRRPAAEKNGFEATAIVTESPRRCINLSQHVVRVRSSPFLYTAARSCSGAHHLNWEVAVVTAAFAEGYVDVGGARPVKLLAPNILTSVLLLRG